MRNDVYIASVDGDMALALSGSFDTAQLPRIASEPVTVTVARSVRPGFESQYLEWTEEMVATVRKFHGCLGAGVLHPGPGGGEHQIIVRFVDGLHLREWERSPQRAVLMAKSAGFVEHERVMRTVGVDNWFELSQRAEPSRPLWGRIVTDMAWVYPVAIATSLVVAPRIAQLPFAVRVTVSTLLITAVMRLAVGPLRSKLRAHRRL
ncbi:MAG: antibiotic biosynthesis monooxygenase, partial [Actinomycetota bacterium]|nr:antibiotic biosynthesis monooxygenase [Actinomycetota bacterium]